MSFLEAFDLYKFYYADEDEIRALRGISLKASNKEMIAITGPSGSGKTTFLLCLAGIINPDGGYITIDGTRLKRNSEAERTHVRAKYFGVILQNKNLFNHFSVEENIAFQMYLANKFDKKKLNQLIEFVELENRKNFLPFQLSGGEVAKASLAVALANDPKILFADEPTSEVDSVSEEKILKLFAEYCKQGGIIITTTHNKKVSDHATRIVKILDGREVKDN